MGRKIPAKKHRGVKDPLAQQAKRWQSIKGKINAPPKDPDEQPVPRSLMNLFGSHNLKTKDTEKKKRRKIHDSSGGERNVQNPVAQLRRLPGESGRSFSLRINGAIRALNGSTEELDYPIETEEEDVKGERMADQRRRRERKRRRNKSNTEETNTNKLTRGQRLTLKKKAKKLRQTENEESREVVYERVGFGEVAHAPPVLRFKNKKTNNVDGEVRAGRRDLLLNRILQPPADRVRLERARQEAVDAYRALKHKRTPPASH